MKKIINVLIALTLALVNREIKKHEPTGDRIQLLNFMALQGSLAVAEKLSSKSEKRIAHNHAAQSLLHVMTMVLEGKIKLIALTMNSRDNGQRISLELINSATAAARSN